MTKNLGSSAGRAVSWTLVDQGASTLLNFAYSIILARLVTPDEFGTVALLSLFLGIATVFMNGGLTIAIIQKKDTTIEDESTVFWFNLIISLVMGLVIILIAPLIADFYQKEVLKPLAYWSVFTFVLSACNSLQHALMAKRLEMKIPFIANFLGIVGSIAVSIWMAWKGYGVWALAAQTVVMAVIQTIVTWSMSNWRPRWCFRYESFRQLFSFGGYIFLTNIISICYERCFSVMLGKTVGAHDLGIYNRAYTSQNMATGALTQVVNRVAFPVFSQCQGDKDQLLKAFRYSQRAVMCLNMPAMIGLALLAKPFIAVVYGVQWLSAAPILAVLAIAASYYPMQVLNLSLLSSFGKGRSYLMLEIAKKSIGITIIVIASHYGVMAVAKGALTTSVITLIFNTYLTRRHTGFGLLKQWVDLFPTVLSCICMSVALHFYQLHFTSDNELFHLLSSVLVGAICYAISSLLFQKENVREMIKLFAKKSLV